jgi:cytochrome c556
MWGNNMNSIKIILVAVIISVLGVSVSYARHHGERAWVSRDGLMHLISDQRGILEDIAETGNSAEDAAEFIRAANALSVLFGMIPSVFEKDDMPDISRSKSEIWSNWDDFVAVANAQSVVAASIAITASTSGLDAAKGKVEEIDCGSCHGPYRNDAP